MAGFLDHLAAADAAIGDHVCTPGAFRPAVGEVIEDVPVAIEHPAEADVLQRGSIVRAKPVAWLPLALVPRVVQNDLVDAEGYRWKVSAAATRPGDGRWWRAEVDRLTPL